MPSFTETHPPGVTIEIDPAVIKDLKWITGDLRHVYENLMNGYVGQDRMEEFCSGLLSPRIRDLEKLILKFEGKLP